MTINDAAAALAVAENHFNWAEPNYIDAACYEVKAAWTSLRAALKESKEAQNEGTEKTA